MGHPEDGLVTTLHRAAPRWRAGTGCVGVLTRFDLEATPLHHRSDPVARHRVPHEAVCDLSRFSAGTLRQRWGSFRVGFDLADGTRGLWLN